MRIRVENSSFRKFDHGQHVMSKNLFTHLKTNDGDVRIEFAVIRLDDCSLLTISHILRPSLEPRDAAMEHS